MSMRLSRAAAAALSVALLAGATPAIADDYESDRAGHPLRILAYIAHPIGMFFEYLIFRPAHWVGSHEPLKTIVGHED